MPFASYQHLSDEDARAVVAYLRTVPPYRQARPRQENKLGFMQKLMFKVIGVQMHKPIAGVPAPDRTNKIEYGHYLLRVAACGDCHSLAEKGPRPETDPLAFAGSEVPFEDPGLGKVYASNITGDAETGLGRYDAAAIKQALRNGTRLDGKKMAPPMSILIPHLSGMTEDDLDALVAYLKTLPAAKRKRAGAPARRAAARPAGQLTQDMSEDVVDQSAAAAPPPEPPPGRIGLRASSSCWARPRAAPSVERARRRCSAAWPRSTSAG